MPLHRSGDKLAWGPCAKGIQAQPRRQAPNARSGSGRLVPGPHCLGSQQPRKLSAGSTATSGGRRRESQLGGPAARWAVGRQGWRIGPTFPSRGPHLTGLSQVPTPTRSPHLVPAIKGITAHCRNTFPLSQPGCDLRRPLSVIMTVWGPGHWRAVAGS